MRVSRIQIKNFANFANFEVSTGDSLVIVGENKVGKSNLIFALRLILDPSLSERDRQLNLEHFWDGLGEGKLGTTIEISVDLTDYADDPHLIAHLADCIVNPGPPLVSRLTYRFQPKANLQGAPQSLADYEYIIFGGLNPDNAVRPTLRRMLPLDVMDALRDSEKDLATWRRSPLRPLIETMAEGLDRATRDEIQTQVDAAQAELAGHEDVHAVAQMIEQRLIDIVGPQHATAMSLGLTPTHVDTLLRGLRLLIDNGSRGVSEASLGTANLIFLALKSLELDRLVEEGERNHTFLAVEEPEAHLHPHVQRLVYRYILEGRTAVGANLDAKQPRLTTILTTHSPHIASVAPLRSIVLLRYDRATGSTVGVSTAETPLTETDKADLQRYVDVTRGELFFARGIVLVEGDAERFLVPAFAQVLGIPLDVLGISVCSVGGTNFAPYVKLLSSSGLGIHYVALTDRDPVAERRSRAFDRVQSLLKIVDPENDHASLTEDELFTRGAEHGFFVNDNTLEPVLFQNGLGRAMQQVLLSELPLRRAARDVLASWVDNPVSLDADGLIKLIDRIGKGRFAQKLAPLIDIASCPIYIRQALERIRDAVA